MKRTRNIFSALCVLGLATLACNAVLPTRGLTPTQPATLLAPNANPMQLTEAQVPRIAVEDAKAAFDSGQAIIVDVRAPEAYSAEHVKGALSLPLGLFESDLANLPLMKDQWIITYCT
ncbi:MAG: rhodanese-like domain-containing protein [Anaerolineales bacterium]|nr:rhodanese-like domain-containing protein [Anaerolineales bacterium]